MNRITPATIQERSNISDNRAKILHMDDTLISKKEGRIIFKKIFKIEKEEIDE